MPLSPREALLARTRQCRFRFRYIPDPDGVDIVEKLARDVWETPAEVEARGGADCDGLSVWTLIRAAQATVPAGQEWALVAGPVRQRQVWGGHAWVELLEVSPAGPVRWWADPTWGLWPDAPVRLGYPENRLPQKRWVYDERKRLFVRQDRYTWEGA